MPYVSRAKAVRHELAESGSVEEKLAAKDKELHDAKLAVKLKVRLLQFIFDAAGSDQACLQISPARPVSSEFYLTSGVS